jgi:hypothetical protein
MDEILLARPGWQERVADALRRAPRPIPVDDRLMPRRERLDTETSWPRVDRGAMPPPRPAATLLLLYPGPDGELRLPLTVRHEALRAHAGEVSLPGGAVDDADPSREATALRETLEEIGVAPDGIAILGTLDDIWIPVTNFSIRPCASCCTRGRSPTRSCTGRAGRCGSAAIEPRGSWSGAPPPARWPCS